ncbi:(2Fe-2S)-binding protein [Nonomuraea sp. WAC 01424]|uniref:2Fe-2S iron-sulfur cluster-binding protein n=1 Tax=Nonomuraea sp. WAC 01424 TaxID=2203200 RepID=UPI000F7A6456|nr:2Fe-2S iron-sulfur cluster-binding protein [Nonomuraea sp. WAC 01424]RSN05817.1 (2Fe-2S)-binding protein [Nonomuraea sp. WAC 01424]
MDGPVLRQLRVNGRAYEPPADPRVSLLDFLRDHLRLTGTKNACDQGACGACTILADGQRVYACLLLAVQCEGMDIVTVEDLVEDELGARVQDAFVRYDAMQCGYCTPGQICSVVGLLAEWRDGVPSAATPDLTAPLDRLTGAELGERMAGNLCRCGAYHHIAAAIREVAGT